MARVSPFVGWEIQERGCVCARTGVAFSEGDRVYSVLCRRGAGEVWRRLDFSEVGWAEDPKDFEVLCRWQSVYRRGVVGRQREGGNEAEVDVEGVLRGLLLGGDEGKFAHCMVLALMLERRRRLRRVGEREDERGRWLVYEHVGSGEVWVVPERIPREGEWGVLEREVREVLRGGG